MSLSTLLFPNALPFDEIIARYPPRPAGSVVTRIAPSPTGFLHIGAIFQALINSHLAHQSGSNGVFIVRIEDTDQERLVPEAMALIIDGLNTFGIHIDEGPLNSQGGSDFVDLGKYGPYIQSQRRQIYHSAIAQLLDQGKAYPCFMTAEELQIMRDQQQAAKLPTGVYGSYAKWRDASIEQVQQALGQGLAFVIRLKNLTQPGARIAFHDLIKGDVQMDAYLIDEVLIKKDGLPTYHFAHIVDDRLMGTTHVIRADERLASVPRHHLIGQAFDRAPFTYAHTSAILKLDKGNKRKLSKRKDPEADIRELLKSGYPTTAINEYLMTIIDSRFEEWKLANPDQSYSSFPIDLSRLNQSGALFDRDKLNSISNAYLSGLSHDEFVTQARTWCEVYDPDLYQQFVSHPVLAQAAANIERLSDKDPKRYTTFSDLRNNVAFFFDPLFEEIQKSGPALPAMITDEVREKFVAEYLSQLDLTVSTEQWFEQLKQIGVRFGFATNNAQYKEGGYIGKIGDLAMMLRILLCASAQTPDLYSVMQVMGREMVERRLKR